MTENCYDKMAFSRRVHHKGIGDYAYEGEYIHENINKSIEVDLIDE